MTTTKINQAEASRAPSNEGQEGQNGWKTVRFEILERIESLPSLSNVITEFLALANREYFTAKDFEKVLSKDQALVARLLKVANSGLYGRSRSINAIPEAVVLIGLESLKKIVYAVSAEGLIRKKLQNYNYHEQQGFWLHALGAGYTSRVLAEASPACQMRGDEAFVAGLLHDVGKLVLDEFLETGPGYHVSREQEIEVVGLDHAELAEYIFKQWNLPESVSTAVRYHHNYRTDGNIHLGAAILSLAQGICGVWKIGRNSRVDLSEEVPREQFEEVLGVLNIHSGKWAQIIWDIRQSLVNLDIIYQGE